MNSFVKGVITGAGIMLVLVLSIAAFRFFNERDKKIYEYVEQQHAIQEMREDYGNRDPYEFLDTPGIRGAADNGYEQFRRDRDEILQRWGSPGAGQ
ncbi:hypothetical protein FACS1894130_11240 [Spirochaetia bacterium]|nr:hypothetical protein FACS1894130_11240 [Spirochaetia bacterium]